MRREVRHMLSKLNRQKVDLVAHHFRVLTGVDPARAALMAAFGYTAAQAGALLWDRCKRGSRLRHGQMNRNQKRRARRKVQP